MKKLPLKTCEACGGTWFREVNLDRFRPWNEGSAWGFEDPRACITGMPMTVVVCLCGTPFRPRVGGVRGGHTPNVEINQFFESLACVDRKDSFRKEWLAHEQRMVQDFIPREDLRMLCREVAALEHRVGRLIARQAGKSRKPGGRWRVPQRKPDSKAKGRDWLALEVQKRGLTYDEARAVVGAILDAMVEALRAGESVQTPIGEFQIKRRTKPHTRMRFGRVQTMHYWPKRVVFKAAEPEGRTEQ